MLNEKSAWTAIVIFYRLQSPESKQFFQFDSKGNMYIYAPGVGCTGEAKLVGPGDKLIFLTSSQWEES